VLPAAVNSFILIEAVPLTAGRGVSMEYDYSFVVWPDETWAFDRAVYDYFRLLRSRTEMRFTEKNLNGSGPAWGTTG